MSIPRRIIQTAKTRSLKPLDKAGATNLKLLHPDWEYMLFDDEDVTRFVTNEFPEYKRYFDDFQQPIQRYDFFRYLVVFRFGGFYFDLDVFLSESIDALVEAESVFPFEELTLNNFLTARYGMDWEIGNYAFGGTPGNLFLQAVIENCVRAQSDRVWLQEMMGGVPGPLRTNFYVFNTTGPGLLSRTFAENPEVARRVEVLFPKNVCDSETWHHFGDYGVHLMTGSWRREGGFLRRRITRWYESWWRTRLLPQSTKRGPTRDIGHQRAFSPLASV